MRMRIRSLMVVLVAAATVAVSAQNNAGRAALEAARKMEVVDGNLKGAIEQYKKIAQSADRAVAATALVRMAECYRKLGDGQARQIFEQVLRDYADQPDASSIARAGLGGAETGRAKGDRPVWTGGFVDGFGTVSPDGRYLTYTDWPGNAALMLHDMATGTNRRLTGPGGQGATQFSSISRDGRQVAFEWRNDQRRYELRVASLEGTGIPESRRLLDLEDAEEVAPFDWSPDGKWIAVGISRKDRTVQIGLVAVKDGALRVLKSLVHWKLDTKIFFSPDGRYVAYDRLAGGTTNDRHLFVIAVDGSRETDAVEHPSQNKVMGWSPDGKALLFASDRSGSIGLWMVRVSDGNPQGPATLVKPDIGTSWSNGLTASGTMYVWKSASPTYIQVAPIDLTAGKLVATSSPIFQRFIGSRGRPDWSADGKFLAYSSCGGLGGGPCTLFIRSTETGQVRELRPQLAYFFFPRWSPNGRALMSPGTDLKGRQAVFSIDAQTGDVSVLLTRDEVDKEIARAQWGPDGKSVCYRARDQRLICRDLTSAKETEVGRASSDWGAFAVSPDGRAVAAIAADASGNTTVVVGPLHGDRRPVLRLSSPASIVLPQVFHWTLDGRALVVVKQPSENREHNELWLVPVDGAAPRRLDINTDSWQLGNGFRLSPDGRQIAFVASAGKPGEEIWALENFLPAQAAAKPSVKK